jgi:hypothetical protein
MIYKKIKAWLIITTILTIQDLSGFRWPSWREYILLPWYRLFIRKNELHISLGMDSKLIQKMDNYEFSSYYQDLARRRSIAHNKTIDE